MTLLNPWILFALPPLLYLYIKNLPQESSLQTKLLYLSLVFMFISISQPVLSHTISDEKFNSQEYIIALDASYSMQADDLKPTRYDMAKEAIKELLILHPKDKFTIFAFTSNTLLISPPTTDIAVSIQALDALNPMYILTKSTNFYKLFMSIAKISLKKKNLIIFSDGGDEQDINKLVRILKKNNIIPYFIATATHTGAALKKDNKYLKDLHNSLVISKINPILKDVASLSDGYYYELSSLNIINSISKDIQNRTLKKEIKLKVQKYKELFFIPLFIAFILYFLAITKLHQIYILIPIFLLPYKVDASFLDFYHLKEAKSYYISKEYNLAAKEFHAMEPSVQSYYNLATSYYKACQYKNALKYYSQIKTHHRKIKQSIFYNMANAAVHLKEYDKAKELYKKALTLGNDIDSLYNLNLLVKLHLKSAKVQKNTQVQKEKKSKKSSAKKGNSKKQSNKKGSKRESSQSANGASNNQQKYKTKITKKQYHKKKANYKMGYKAYEIINKGYTNEKEPW